LIIPTALLKLFIVTDLREQIHILERTLHENASTVNSQEGHIKKLDEMIMVLRTDSAHWERKSISASKELLRLNSASQGQMLSQHNDLRDKNSSLKNKLKVTCFFYHDVKSKMYIFFAFFCHISDFFLIVYSLHLIVYIIGTGGCNKNKFETV
jgi:hypothetical protein